MLTKEQSDMAEKCTPFWGEHTADDYEGYSGLVRYWWIAEYKSNYNGVQDTWTWIYPATTVKEAKEKAKNQVKYGKYSVFSRVRPAKIMEMVEYLCAIEKYIESDDDLPF